MRRLCILAVVALLAAPSRAGEPDATSLIDLQGGGFIFNYNIGEVFYGVLVKPRRALPVGTEIEARFEDPAGGPPIVVTETFRGSPRPISLRTPPVQGVVANRDYRVTIRLRDASGALLGETARTFRSDLDQSILPSHRLTVGPGYQPAPPEPKPE
jgi:hypothetical protein